MLCNPRIYQRCTWWKERTYGTRCPVMRDLREMFIRWMFAVLADGAMRCAGHMPHDVNFMNCMLLLFFLLLLLLLKPHLLCTWTWYLPIIVITLIWFGVCGKVRVAWHCAILFAKAVKIARCLGCILLICYALKRLRILLEARNSVHLAISAVSYVPPYLVAIYL